MMCFDNAKGVQGVERAESVRTQSSKLKCVLQVSRCGRIHFKYAVIYLSVVYPAIIYPCRNMLGRCGEAGVGKGGVVARRWCVAQGWGRWSLRFGRDGVRNDVWAAVDGGFGVGGWLVSARSLSSTLRTHTQSLHPTNRQNPPAAPTLLLNSPTKAHTPSPGPTPPPIP